MDASEQSQARLLRLLCVAVPLAGSFAGCSTVGAMKVGCTAPLRITHKVSFLDEEHGELTVTRDIPTPGPGVGRWFSAQRAARSRPDRKATM